MRLIGLCTRINLSVKVVGTRAFMVSPSERTSHYILCDDRPETKSLLDTFSNQEPVLTVAKLNKLDVKVHILRRD